MRRAAFVLALAMAAAGCLGGGQGGNDPDPASSKTATADGRTAQPGVPSVTFAIVPEVPRANQSAAFSARGHNLGARTIDSWGWVFGDGATAAGSPTNHTYLTAGDYDVRVNALLSDGSTLSARRALLVLAGGASGNATGPVAAPAPPPPGEFVCEGKPVVEPHATFGADPALPGLRWAVLKTGSRFAAVWESATPATGSVTYWFGNASGATTSTASETVPSTLHAVVIDGLQEGRQMCFTVTMGGTTTPVHAVRTVNAMTSFEDGAPHGAYTLNLLVLSNEGGDLAEVTAGIDRYADLLWDATDGWVRSGAVLVIQDDPTHANLGWPHCYLLSLPVACFNKYDVLVTNAAAPQGAASTYRQGIREPNAAIWMNQYHQAMPGPVSLDDFGAVLVHEVGHYVFDMDDLYGDNTVVTSECYDAATGISIMAGSRDATEFDDPATPCPNQPAGYTTSWELAQGQFPGLPARPAGPVPGPEGNGGLHVQHVYRGL